MTFEVVNQIVPNTSDIHKSTKGDVTLLINGLPLIHIELKNEYVKGGYQQDFGQIEQYTESGFFDEISATLQIFLVSNKVSTKHFARPSATNDFSIAKKIPV